MGWHDLLVEVDGHTISYDGSGNPLNYYNGYKTYTDLKWVQGRQLQSLLVGGAAVSYTYDVDGIRTAKVVDGVEHRYVTRGGKLMRESFGSGDTEVIMDFSYDESGRPFAVSYSKNGGTSFSTYYYATNLQGDVVMIFGRTAVKDADGNVTGYNVKSYGYYTYDAWGNVSVKTAAGNNASVNSLIYRNPIRYRGYVYDNETGFYYLQSRYYDPANHRFINADAPEYSTMSAYGLNNSNLFAYCQNNPVNAIDPTGEWSLWGGIVGGVVGAFVGAISAAVTGGDYKDIIIGAVAGAAAGTVIGVTGDLKAGKTVGRLVGSGLNALGTYIDAKKNGASTGTALLAGGANFAITYKTASLSGSCGDDLFASTLVDSTFGFGGSLTSSAITTALTEYSVQKQQQSANTERNGGLVSQLHVRKSRNRFCVVEIELNYVSINFWYQYLFPMFLNHDLFGALVTDCKRIYGRVVSLYFFLFLCIALPAIFDIFCEILCCHGERNQA